MYEEGRLGQQPLFFTTYKSLNKVLMWQFQNTGYFLVVLVMMNLFSCSPRTAVTVLAEPEQAVVQPAPTKGPCTSFSDLPGEVREQVETAFVLYKDFLKVGNYTEALKYWRIAYNTAPGSNGRVKYHFEDGAAIYRYLYGQVTDSISKKLLVDTIMSIYDKKVECFGEAAYISGMKGFDYYYYFPGYVSNKQIFEFFKANFDQKGQQADYFVVNPFAKLLYDGVMDGSVDLETGRKYTSLILASVTYGKANCKGKQCEAWEIIEEYAPVRLEGLESIDGFYECEYYKNKYFKLFRQYPDSCEIVNLAYARMLRGNCPPDDAGLQEVKAVKGTKCYVAPPAVSCAAQGNENYSQGKYNAAVESYLECVENAADPDQKAKYLLLVAKIYYRDLRNYPKARKYALDAARLKPSWGEPYMLVGNLYASSGPLCGTGRGWESQVVTWPAIDMWTKARSVDAQVAGEASALIARYRQYMPKKEDIFFRNIKAGDSYFVPCWIQESTTVRTAD
jgi:tetratricopeptide (TPR) repeat protein